MKNNNLSIFERIYINLRCRKDLDAKCFCDFNTGTCLMRSRYLQVRENADLSTDDINDQHKETNKSTVLVVSPFITAELSQLIAKRDKMLGKKICIIRYYKNSDIRHKICRFPDAIAFIDDQIRVLEGDIACLDAEYREIISVFQERYERNIEHGDMRLASACVKGVHAKRDKYESEKKLRYDKLIMLVSEKIRIINVVNARIDVYKAWRFSRIRYYYSIASTKSIRLPVSVYSDQELSKIAKQDLMQEYTGKLETTHERFRQLKEEITFQNENTINEVGVDTTENETELYVGVSDEEAIIPSETDGESAE